MLLYNLTNRDGQTTLSVFGETLDKVVAGTHPNFQALLEYLTTTPDEDIDEEHVHDLIDPAVGIGKAMAAITDRVTFDLHTLYFDGLPVEGVLAQHIKDKMLANDQDWHRLVKFMLNLDANPSRRCQAAVYAWVERNGLTITPDGNFIGYKAVQANGESLTAGPNNYVNGELLGEPGVPYHVPHEIGTVVSKKRGDVDDNPALVCSVGLHVGTKDYAEGFGPRLLTVEVNPADVVSVPDSDLEYKIRTCAYKVVALADPVQFSLPSYDPPRFEDDDEDNEDDDDDWNDWNDWDDWDDEEDAEDPDEESASLVIAAQHHSEVVAKPKTLEEHAQDDANLRADLENPTFGHKPLARKWSHLTTESSVRRYRKAHGISLTLRTKVKDALDA